MVRWKLRILLELECEIICMDLMRSGPAGILNKAKWLGMLRSPLIPEHSRIPVIIY